MSTAMAEIQLTAFEMTSDNWHGVLDPKKRKQIQDRLAQRARRKRLADMSRRDTRPKQRKRDPDRTPSTMEIPKRRKTSSSNSVVIEHSTSIASDRIANSNLVAASSTATTNDSGPYHLPSTPQAQTFLSALFDNGTILGIPCGTSFPSKSKPQGSHVPASLQPTLLQLSTVHWQWIDRVPFPEARDEMIIQSGRFEEEEFLRDLFNMETFFLPPGSEPWDPSAYSMAPEFQTKWGWLFPDFQTRGVYGGNVYVQVPSQ